jgi:hypothetical protein
LRDEQQRDDEDEEVVADVAALDASFKEGVHHAQEEVRPHDPVHSSAGRTLSLHEDIR